MYVIQSCIFWSSLLVDILSSVSFFVEYLCRHIYGMLVNIFTPSYFFSDDDFVLTAI